MARAWRRIDQDGNLCGWAVYCPACEAVHPLDTRWSFNGDYDRPTFGPTAPGGNSSLLVATNHPGWKSYDPAKDEARCHSHIVDGRISYCDDCSHKHAGQTLELPHKDDVFPPAEGSE